jgi:transcriptional regulator with XRE-family HTH domain
MARNPPPSEDRRPLLLAFGAAVRLHRKAKGLSQEAFADECGIDRSYMGGVERGERNIALINVEKIVTALGLQPSEFFKALDKPIQSHDAASSKLRKS